MVLNIDPMYLIIKQLEKTFFLWLRVCNYLRINELQAKCIP